MLFAAPHTIEHIGAFPPVHTHQMQSAELIPTRISKPTTGYNSFICVGV